MGKYKVDMTSKVYPDKVVYEIEVEFNNEYIQDVIKQKESFINFMGELKNILSLIIPCPMWLIPSCLKVTRLLTRYIPLLNCQD